MKFRARYTPFGAVVQMYLFCFWVDLKAFYDTDKAYCKRCAEELIEKLNEKI